MKDKVSIL